MGRRRRAFWFLFMRVFRFMSLFVCGHGLLLETRTPTSHVKLSIRGIRRSSVKSEATAEVTQKSCASRFTSCGAR